MAVRLVVRLFIMKQWICLHYNKTIALEICYICAEHEKLCNIFVNICRMLCFLPTLTGRRIIKKKSNILMLRIIIIIIIIIMRITQLSARWLVNYNFPILNSSTNAIHCFCQIYHVSLILLFIISIIINISIIIETISTGPSGKNKIVYKLLTQPHNHLRHGNTEKENQGSNQRLTAPLNPSNVPLSNTV